MSRADKVQWLINTMTSVDRTVIETVDHGTSFEELEQALIRWCKFAQTHRPGGCAVMAATKGQKERRKN